MGLFDCIFQMSDQESSAAIDYMYGPMPGIAEKIKKRLPKWKEWEVAKTVVNTMEDVVRSIKLNQASVEKWSLSQAIIELLTVYVGMAKGQVPDAVSVQVANIYAVYDNDDDVQKFVHHLE